MLPSFARDCRDDPPDQNDIAFLQHSCSNATTADQRSAASSEMSEVLAQGSWLEQGLASCA